MIEFYQPKPEDLWFKAQMLADESTMAYNHAFGGTIPFPKEKWAGWHDRWIVHHENKRFYRYVMENGIFLGEVAYHYDEERGIHLADVILYARYRGKGYGKRALEMLCTVAKDNGVKELYDEIASDNPSVGLFLACGFREIVRTDEHVLVKKEL